jgi:anti-sigma regulatory factor (Ser/Thr protein kinase)/predicted ArsR family transcriptional regulator
VDWVISDGDHDAIAVLRSQLVAYLQRHGDPDSDFDGARLVVSELVTNGVVHAEGPVWVSLDWGDAEPELTVADVGPGFDLTIDLPPADSTGGRGLFISNQIALKLDAHRRRSGGTIVTAVLPVRRAESVSMDPPRRRRALPGLEEASPEGFGKEPFLRALVVQLATSVDEQQGPDAAEAAVAQVAADIGGQMEEEFRRARGIVGRLTTEQIADCYVRLKSAIDGGFRVSEMSGSRIVLVNDRCPFGDAVKKAPSLCRMTSSVFGGIAARNSERSVDVFLEERIAMGDDRCVVVVDLDPPTELPERWSHRYRTPT